jgi:hypothetical protein
MPIEIGSAKQTRIKRQTARGVISGPTLGQILRRTSATFDLQKETYTTEDEMTSTRQVRALRHGVQMVNGSLDGLLSPGTYSDPLSVVLRRDFTVVAPITALGVTITRTGTVYTLTRAAGSFLTANVKIGMVARLTLAMNAANLNKNLLVLSVTATAVTVVTLDGSVLVAEGPTAGVTMTFAGRVTHAADSGQTNIYHTVEEWFPSVPLSERSTDVKFTQADFSLPGNGNATIKFTAIGLSQSEGATAYFTAPAAESNTQVVNAAGGYLMVNGVQQAIVTDLSFSVNGNGAAADGVVGTDVRPDIFSGNVVVTGSFTAYFETADLSALFKNEVSFAIVGALTSGREPQADFITYAMTNVKLTSSTPDDNASGLKRTYAFQSMYDATGGAAAAVNATSIQFHDSAAT